MAVRGLGWEGVRRRLRCREDDGDKDEDGLLGMCERQGWGRGRGS